MKLAFFAVLVVIFPSLTVAMDGVTGHDASVYQDFLYEGESLALVVSKTFSPELVNAKLFDGYISKYSGINFKGIEFWVGAYRTTMKEVADEGVFSLIDGVPKKILDGDGGFFVLFEETLYIVVNELEQHDAFSSLYRLDVGESGLVAVRKLLNFNGLILESRQHLKRLILSGSYGSEAIAFVVDFSNGGKASIESLKAMPQ